jgi:hypothetical protein
LKGEKEKWANEHADASGSIFTFARQRIKRECISFTMKKMII